jgi:CRP-like cAMP-binding protein
MAGRRKSPIRLEHVEPEACTVDLRLEILRRLPFFASLTAADLEQANGLFRENGYTPGEAVYHAGEPAGHLHVVAAGRIKLVRHTPSGQDVLLDVLTPGDFFGRLAPVDGESYPDTAIALTAACVLRIDSEAFRRVLQRFPAVALALLDITASRLGEAQTMVQQLSAHGAEQRIAHVLLRLSAKLGESSDVGLLIQMPLSREDLAEMAGTTVETASRVMSLFQRAGLIQSGRQWVALADRNALQALTESG